MNKKKIITKATKKVLLFFVYSLFFSVQLYFQYQNTSSVGFEIDSIFSSHTNVKVHKKHGEVKENPIFVKHNRLNKRYQPELPITVVDVFHYQFPQYLVTTKQFASKVFCGHNPFLSTYQLRGPPENA